MPLLQRLLAWTGLDFDLDLTPQPFHDITPVRTLGRRPTRDDIETLRGVGITHVVSCLDPSEREAMAFLAGPFHASFVPLPDTIQGDIPRVVQGVRGRAPTGPAGGAS